MSITPQPRRSPSIISRSLACHWLIPLAAASALGVACAPPDATADGAVDPSFDEPAATSEAALERRGTSPGGELDSAPAHEEVDLELAASTLAGSVIAYATSNGSNSQPRQVFGPGVYRANRGELAGVGNDRARLLELAPAMRVRACQHETPAFDTCKVYENLSGSNLRVQVAAGTSRLDVRGLVVAYRDATYRGVAHGFEIGRHEVGLGDFGAVGNDTISSLRVTPGLSARLCSDDPEATVGYTCRTFTSSASTVGASLNDRGSWLEVRPSTVAFRDAAFKGTSQRVGAGTFPLSALGALGNDTMTSILVHEGVETRACSDDPNTTVGGVCATFVKSAPQVAANLDNRTSWIDSRHTVILAPANESASAMDEQVLHGYATSTRGEPLTGGQLRWFSSVDGFLGTGEHLRVRLSRAPGCSSREHVISLVATDARGVERTSRRSIWTYVIC